MVFVPSFQRTITAWNYINLKTSICYYTHFKNYLEKFIFIFLTLIFNIQNNKIRFFYNSKFIENNMIILIQKNYLFLFL